MGFRPTAHTYLFETLGIQTERVEEIKGKRPAKYQHQAVFPIRVSMFDSDSDSDRDETGTDMTHRLGALTQEEKATQLTGGTNSRASPSTRSSTSLRRPRLCSTKRRRRMGTRRSS